MAQMDKATTSLTQLERIKKEKDDIALAKDAVEKAKVEAWDKVEASRKLQVKVGFMLLKSKDANFDI